MRPGRKSKVMFDKNLEDYDLEKTILSTFILDEGKLMNSTKLNPKHFQNKQNRNFFVYLVAFYQKNHTLNIS